MANTEEQESGHMAREEALDRLFLEIEQEKPMTIEYALSVLVKEIYCLGSSHREPADPDRIQANVDAAADLDNVREHIMCHESDAATVLTHPNIR